MTALLAIDTLSVSYGRVPVLHDVGLQVNAGDVLGLVGESGCGKTTLGLAIMGLLPEHATTRGQLHFEGQDLLAMARGPRRAILGDRISLVPQSSSNALDPVYSIGDQMVEAFRAHRTMSRTSAHELAVQWLRDVGIPAPEMRMKAYPHELSGGMRQRVSIAIALALNPSLLIADEPTSALDVTIQAQILRLLRDLIQAHAGAVLLITHDLGVIAQLCNRVAVMYAGQIVEEADTRQLFARPAHPYTKALLASHPARAESGQRLVTIPGRVPDPSHLPRGCSFRPRCPLAQGQCLDQPPWVQVGANHHARCVLYREGYHATAGS
jgi:peptide/nickel transport system ATP-binding protein